MARVTGLTAALAAGVGLGLAVTDLASTGQPPFGAVRNGAWTAWPGSGGPDADPYARAVFARDGRIPLAAAIGVTLLATRDGAGDRLTAGCVYEVGGPIPQAQFWTLTPLDGAGRPFGSGQRAAGLTSSEVVRDAAGEATVTVARSVRSGNWLALPGEGPFTLMLTLYDTPFTAALRAGTASAALPALTRLSCR